MKRKGRLQHVRWLSTPFRQVLKKYKKKAVFASSEKSCIFAFNRIAVYFGHEVGLQAVACAFPMAKTMWQMLKLKKNK
jgi:hypothetical protein